jgi:hypothetical protein
MAFETGFTALSYFRTVYLLAFFVIYLNRIAPNSGYAAGGAIQLDQVGRQS